MLGANLGLLLYGDVSVMYFMTISMKECLPNLEFEPHNFQALGQINCAYLAGSNICSSVKYIVGKIGIVGNNSYFKLFL